MFGIVSKSSREDILLLEQSNSCKYRIFSIPCNDSLLH